MHIVYNESFNYISHTITSKQYYKSLVLNHVWCQIEATLAGGGGTLPQPDAGSGHQDGGQVQDGGRGEVHHQPQQLEHVHTAGC